MPDEYIMAKLAAQDGADQRGRQLPAIEGVRECRMLLDRVPDAEPQHERRGEDRPPVVDEERRDDDQDARLQRDVLPHVADEADHLRHEVDHEEERHQEHDAADERRVDHELLGLRGELVLPLERLGKAGQHVRELAGLLARAHQADEHLAEHLGELGQRAREVLAALDRLDQARDHFAEARVLHALAQVVQALDDRHAGARELLEVEAEVDEVLPRDAAAADEARRLAGLGADDEVEPHAREALLEIEDVDRLDAADDVLALRVDGLVGKQGHKPSRPTPCGR
jgi:hypothetical protein